MTRTELNAFADRISNLCVADGYTQEEIDRLEEQFIAECQALGLDPREVEASAEQDRRFRSAMAAVNHVSKWAPRTGRTYGIVKGERKWASDKSED